MFYIIQHDLCYVNHFQHNLCKIFSMNTFHEKLQALRKEKGLLQKEAADEMNISRTAYSNYEQGIRQPSFDVLKIICDFYDVSADYLIGRTDSY